jgi:MYXO-CTERM domain-containing protein
MATSLGQCGGMPMCGDGSLDMGEVCDDGDTNSGDGCDSMCLSNETCGNGILDGAAGETCDDGNTLDDDGCASTCVLTAETFDPIPIEEESSCGCRVAGDDTKSRSGFVWAILALGLAGWRKRMRQRS